MSAPTTLPTITELPMLDLRQAWDSLAPDVRAQLGMAAIAIGARHLATMIEAHEMEVSPARHSNAFDAGDIEAVSLAGVLVEAKVLRGDVARLRPPGLVALGVRQCAGCGCTDQCACAGGCHWIGPLRCSACGEAA